MAIIDLYEFGTNKQLGQTILADLPRVGEFFILSEGIDENWAEKFYIVKSITHTLQDGYKSIHIERYDVEEARKKEERIQAAMERINKRFKGEENGSEK